MNALARARRALPFTFVVYASEASVTLLAGLGPAGGASELLRSAEDVLGPARVLERSEELARLLDLGLLSSLVAMAAVLALGPLLQLAWFAALDEHDSGETWWAALARAARSYGRAWGASALVLLGTLAALLPFAGLAYALHRALHASPNARVHDLALAAALAPTLFVTALAFVWHDLARAHSAFLPARASARRALRRVFVARNLAVAGATTLLGGAAFALAFSLARALSGATAGELAAVIVLQLALFTRLALRSLWLACAVAEVDPLARAQRLQPDAPA